MQLFYNEHITPELKNFLFDKEESRHIVRVLRKKTGDVIYLTNGKGWLFTCVIIDANDKRCTVRIEKSTHQPKPGNYYLHIAIAPTKSNDRYEWFLEKATEIGIDEITPLICTRSERKIIKPGRYQKVIIAATKQSLKTYLPKLNPLTHFDDFVAKKHPGINLIAHCEDTERSQLKNSVQPGERITVLIGPEGDFSSQEIETALKKGFIPLSLGKSRLRTETAGLKVCCDVAFINS